MGLFDTFKKILYHKEEQGEEEKKVLQTYEKGLEKTRKEFVSKLSLLGVKYTKVSPEYFEELENL